MRIGPIYSLKIPFFLYFFKSFQKTSQFPMALGEKDGVS